MRPAEYKKRILIRLFAVILSVLIIEPFLPPQKALAEEEKGNGERGASDETGGEINTEEGNIEWPSLAKEPYGKSAILMERDTGAILYSKSPDEKLFPASITKIMTGLLAVENLNLNDTVTVTPEMIESIPADAAIQGISVGEVITVKDCIYSLMLISSADMAEALAFQVAGSEEAFAVMMTERAHEIGAVNTNFTNATGLHDDNHYTTARDMALIAAEASQNPTFAAIWGTGEYELAATNKEAAQTIWHRHNMLVSRRGEYYKYATGGKTGYTDEAGRTLVTCGEKDGLNLVAVIMFSTTEDVFNDTRTLLEYGFNSFKKADIGGNETRFGQSGGSGYSAVNKVYGGKESPFALGEGSAVIPKNVSLSDVGYRLEITDSDEKSKKIAELTYMYDGNPLGYADIYINNAEDITHSAASSLEKWEKETENIDVKEIFSLNIFFIIGGGAAVVIIVFVLRLRIKAAKRRYNTKKYYYK